MSTYAYREPTAFLPEGARTFESRSLPFSGTFLRGDVLVISSGVVSKGSSNPAANTLAGLAQYGSADVYVSTSPSDSTLFGASTVGTALTPNEPNNAHFVPFHNGNVFEFSLKDAWNQNLVGSTTFGLTLDASGFWVLDSTDGNKMFVIQEAVSDAMINPGGPQNGDVGVRVLAFVPQGTSLGY